MVARPRGDRFGGLQLLAEALDPQGDARGLARLDGVFQILDGFLDGGFAQAGRMPL